jgi:hypothetical protein
MSLKNLAVGSDVEAPSTDNLGGGFTVNSGLYKMLIDVAYETKSAGGAIGIVLHLKSADPNERVQHRETLYVTSKAGLNYYLGGKNKDKKILLPGMQLFQQICKICVPGTKPDELIQEKKTIKVWNNEMKAEVPTEVDFIPELKDKPLYVGIVRVKENKRVPKEPGSSIYVDTPEAREYSKIHRVFYTDGFSTEEKEKGGEKPTFIQTWKKKHTSDYVDVSKWKEQKGAGGSSAAAAASAAASEVDDDLFD